MPLSIGAIALPVASGIDTRSDEKVVPPTKFLDLHNVTFDRLGALKKRNGYRALSTAIQNSSDVLANARGMATRDAEILVFTDKRAYSYRPSADAWSDTGEVAATTATTLPIARTGSYQTQPDVAERSGVRVAAWEDSRGGVWCQVSEATTGHAIQAQVQLDSSTFARNPRCTWSGNTLLVIWTREDVGRLMIGTVSTSSPSVAPTVSILVNDLDGANPYFDAENAPNGPDGIFGLRPAVIAWGRSSGITVAYLSPGGTLATALDGLIPPFQYSDGATDGIAVTYDGVTRHIAVVWIDGGGTTLRARFIDASALNVTTRMVPALGAGGVTYTKITAAFGGSGADGNPQLYWAAETAASRTDLSMIESGAAVLTTTALDAISTRLRGHGLVSRAWHDGANLTASLSQPSSARAVTIATGGFGTWTAGYLCEDVGGGLVAAFGGTNLVETSIGGSPQYGLPGPLGDRAVRVTVANTGWAAPNTAFLDPGANDICGIVVMRVVSAIIGNATVLSKSDFLGGPGFTLFVTPSVVTFLVDHTVPGNIAVTATASSSILSGGEWFIVAFALDRAAATARVAIQALDDAETAIGTSQPIGALGSASNAGAPFRVARMGSLTNAIDIAACYIGVGVGAASGIPANIATVLSSFRSFLQGTFPITVADGDAYVMIAHTVRFFPYVAALRLSDTSGISTPGNTIVARLMPGEAAGANLRTTGAGTRAWTRSLPSVAPINLDDANIYTREHAAPLPYRIQLSSQDGDQFSEQGIKLATLNMRPSYQTAQLGRGLYLASAAPMHYDGAAWHEADFHCAPDFGYDLTGNPVNLSTTVTVGAVGAVPNGTYLYAYWYEVVDVQGELHRGPVSVKILATMTGGPRKFNITLPTCRLTNFTNVRICVARSIQGATGTDASIPLFKVTSNDVTVATGDNRYVTNDPNVDTVSFVDNLTDAQLQLREPLYTNGGILSNAPAPWGGGIIATGKGRLFWNDSTDPHMIRYSQQRADDTALEAPVDLSLRKDEFGGAITAIAIMDDAVFPFTSTAAFVFGGPGPLADPSVSPDANAFTPVDLVTTDVGCVEVSSVGVTPIGIAFKSAKGIMLLARDRTIVNIGDDVQGFDAQNVVRTTLRSTAQRVMFLTDAGRTLMWDYHQNAWSTFTNHEGLDAVEVDGIYYYLRTNSVVYAETPGVFRDNDEHVAIRIETAWIHFASQLQGWQRILYAYFLGTFLSPHTLSVRYRIDYNSTYSAPILSDVNSNFSPSLYGTGIYGAGVYGGPIGGSQRYQRAIHINKRSQSISFVIEDIEGGDDFGASFELSEILLIGGGLGPAFRVGAARLA